jgi:hypothetical protein
VKKAGQSAFIEAVHVAPRRVLALTLIAGCAADPDVLSIRDADKKLASTNAKELLANG